jgi:mRNA-degrading endonuclease toxin of MazEF toxin-antitoxin module
MRHQLRVPDKAGMNKKSGEVSSATLEEIENCMLFTLGVKI